MYKPVSLLPAQVQHSRTRGRCHNVKCAPAGDAESESRSNWARAHGRRWCKEPHAGALAEILGGAQAGVVVADARAALEPTWSLSQRQVCARWRCRVGKSFQLGADTVDAGAKSHTWEHSLRSSVGAQAGVIGAGAWTALEPTWSMSQRQVCARWRCRVGKSFQLGAGTR